VFFYEKVERILMAAVLFFELEVDSESWLIAFYMCLNYFTSLSWLPWIPRFLVDDSLTI
jgi:hypothetical protein